MTKILLLLSLIAIIMLSGCVNPINSPYNNFETLDLASLEGQNITVSGQAVRFFPYLQVGSNYDELLGLMDKDGFSVKFLPRGNRHINSKEREQYTIYGTVKKDNLSGCYPSCSPIYYIEEHTPPK